MVMITLVFWGRLITYIYVLLVQLGSLNIEMGGGLRSDDGGRGGVTLQPPPPRPQICHLMPLHFKDIKRNDG